MKKILTVLMAVLLLLACTACGGSGGGTSQGGAAAASSGGDGSTSNGDSSAVSSNNGGELYPALKRGLFFNMASDKIFDFVLKLSAPSSYSVGGIFAASFSASISPK